MAGIFGRGGPFLRSPSTWRRYTCLCCVTYPAVTLFGRWSKSNMGVSIPLPLDFPKLFPGAQAAHSVLNARRLFCWVGTIKALHRTWTFASAWQLSPVYHEFNSNTSLIERFNQKGRLAGEYLHLPNWRTVGVDGAGTLRSVRPQAHGIRYGRPQDPRRVLFTASLEPSPTPDPHMFPPRCP